jgi:hypothetical protein
MIETKEKAEGVLVDVWHGDYHLVVMEDWFPTNPREHFSNLGTFYTWERDRSSPDKNPYSSKDDFYGEEDSEYSDDIFIWPVKRRGYYEEYFELVNLGDYYDGFVFVTKAQAKEEFPDLNDNELEERVKKCFEAELELYADWVNGNVYGFVVTKLDEDMVEVDVDSCWGFYGRKDSGMAEHFTGTDYEFFKEMI